MITSDGKNLSIFESFLYDKNLPKAEHYPKNVDDVLEEMSMVAFLPSKETRNNVDDSKLTFLYSNSLNGINKWSSVTQRINVKNKKLKYLLNKIYDKIKPYDDIEEIFDKIKEQKESLKLSYEGVESYLSKIEYYEKAGQKYIADQLRAELIKYEYELTLQENGITAYITEQNLVELYKNSPRLLRLDWIMNFARAIPPTIIERKLEIDELCIFDNYVILHYDPFRTGSLAEIHYGDTKEKIKDHLKEKQKAKDPILFGVFYGSNKLYYIADWIDEYCDLTLDELKKMTTVEFLDVQNFYTNNGELINISKKR